MSDVRSQFYKNYVSRFKTYQMKRGEEEVRRHWRWCDFKYLPALRRIDPHEPILELGCGPGYMLEYLRHRGYTNLLGIDLSQEQVDLACSRGLPAEKAEAFRFLEKKEDGYAAIVAIDFVEHFTKEELLKLIPLVHGALRKDGLLLLQTPNGQGLFPGQVIYGDLTHMTILTQSSMTQLLSLAGFRNIEFRETGPVPDGLKGRIRVFLWRVLRVMARIIRGIEVDYPWGIWTENFICWCRK